MVAADSILAPARYTCVVWLSLLQIVMMIFKYLSEGSHSFQVARSERSLQPPVLLKLSDSDLAKMEKGHIFATTDINTLWAMNNVRQWLQHRNRSAQENVQKIYFRLRLHILSKSCTSGCRFVCETRKEDGQRYPPKTIYQILCCASCEEKIRKHQTSWIRILTSASYMELAIVCSISSPRLGLAQQLGKPFHSRQKKRSSFGRRFLIRMILPVCKGLFFSTLVKFCV